MKIDGLRVVDAHKPLEITITRRDISGSKKKDPGGCAAAKALIRTPGVEAARVHLSRTYVKIAGKWVRYNTPESIRSEIISFDRGAVFEPGDYRLIPAQPSAQLGVRRQTGPKQTKGKPRQPSHTIHGVRQNAKKGMQRK